MAETRGVNKKIKSDIIAMNQTLKELDQYMKNLSDDVWKMMTGSGSNGPLWNGAKADKFLRKAVKNIKNNVSDYNYAANIVNSLAGSYELTVRKDS